jgi:hypothetical protein
MHRSVESRHDFLQYDTVELAQYEPLRAARRTGQRADLLRCEAVFSYRLERTGTGTKHQ